MKRNTGNQQSNRRGIVLFLVVAIVLMMTLLTYGFLVAMRTQNLAAAQSGERLQSRHAAFSARELVCSILEAPLSQRFELGDETSNEPLFRMLELKTREEQTDQWTSRSFVLYDLRSKRFGIQNQSSKINLQKLLVNDQENPGWGRECLLRLPQMTETMADRILDWIDEDDEPREFGAESEFYLENSLVLPRNGIPPNLDELAWIPEVTQEMIDGSRGKLRSGDQRTDTPNTNPLGVDGIEGTWSEYLTVHSGERNESFDGTPRINLNSSNLADLHGKLVELASVEIANFVILARQHGLLRLASEAIPNDTQDLKSAGQIQVDFSVAPSYEFENKVDLLLSRVRIGSEDDEPDNVILVESPLRRSTSALDTLTENFLDATTVTDANVFWGRVNVLLAPREVLMSVPGIDESLAEQILNARDAQKTQRKTCFWLVDSGLVTMDRMRQLEPMITNRGEVAQFICGGWSDRQSAPIVYQVELDATQGASRQRYCRRILETGIVDRLVGEPDIGR